MIDLSPISDRTALLLFSTTEIANSNFPLSLFDNFPQLSFGCSDFTFDFFSCREKTEHDRLNSNFSKN